MPGARRGREREGRRPLLRGGLFLVMVSAVTAASTIFAVAEGSQTLAVADFDFKDTSGEVRSQTAEHEARLRAFGVTLEGALAENAKIDVVALSCPSKRCSAGELGLADLAGRARSSHARFLVIGEVHKMSTLVGWVKYAVLDLGTGKPVCDRYLTYRGDTDEAWRRAAAFTARDIGTHCLQ